MNQLTSPNKAGKLWSRRLIVFLGLLLAPTLVVLYPAKPEPEIQVVGELSEVDVAHIRAEVRRYNSNPLSTKLSVKSLTPIPARVAERFKASKVRIRVIEARTSGFCAVFA